MSISFLFSVYKTCRNVLNSTTSLVVFEETSILNANTAMPRPAYLICISCSSFRLRCRRRLARNTLAHIQEHTYKLTQFASFCLKLNYKWIAKQDGRLAPEYFSPNYKYFDQLLQTVKNKTTVLILVFKEFLQTSI